MADKQLAEGHVIQVIGPAVDVAFPAGQLPKLATALTLNNPAIDAQPDNLVLEVAQHLGENVVRAVAMDATEGLVRGAKVVNTGAPIAMPVLSCRRPLPKLPPASTLTVPAPPQLNSQKLELARLVAVEEM